MGKGSVCTLKFLRVDELVVKSNFGQLFQNSAKSWAAKQNGYQQVINLSN